MKHSWAPFGRHGTVNIARPAKALAAVSLLFILAFWIWGYNLLGIIGSQIDLSAPDSPFVGWPLARVCSEAAWRPGLVFICDNNSGGIGNIRNYILTCLRYSIEAGATGLVMPQIETRSEDNLSNLFKGYRPFDYFFDESHFRNSLEGSCPQISIYGKVEDVPNLKSTRAERITPNSYGRRAGCDDKDLNRHSDLFGQRFDTWLASTAGMFKLKPISALDPRLIRLNWGVQWDFPAWKDGPEFVSTFGGILRFRPDILALGKTTTAIMRRFARSTSHGGDFMGVHLRTENDILKFWPTFETQTTAILSQASRHGFHTVYLATGNETEADKFAARASSQNHLRVTTKQQLLQNYPRELGLLESLTWDQQALVDFVVLLYSDFFVGAHPSSFSINVAGKRHLKKEGLHTRPWKVGREGDGRSFLVGKYESYWEDWLFMYDSLWP